MVHSDRRRQGLRSQQRPDRSNNLSGNQECYARVSVSEGTHSATFSNGTLLYSRKVCRGGVVSETKPSNHTQAILSWNESGGC